MKPQEAINVLQKYQSIPKSKVSKESYELAISALEKQIPKNVVIKRVAFDTLDYICPCCTNRQISKCAGVWVAGQKFKYCSHCGQALDWSDTE